MSVGVHSADYLLFAVGESHRELLIAGHIFTFGTEDQRRRFVVPLAKGEKSAHGV